MSNSKCEKKQKKGFVTEKKEKKIIDILIHGHSAAPQQVRHVQTRNTNLISNTISKLVEGTDEGVERVRARNRHRCPKKGC